MAKTVYDHIAYNNWKIVFLLFCFPVVLCALLYGGIYLAVMTDPQGSVDVVHELFFSIAPIVIGVVAVWMMISYSCGDQMMLHFAGAKKIGDDLPSRKIKCMVENCAIAAGLPCPAVYLIKDESLNAFATGRGPHDAAIALTTGIVNKLEPLELQGVIAHEMAHIGNRDVRLNMIVITGIGIVSLLGEILLRSAPRGRSGSKNNTGGLFVLIGLACLVFGWLLGPLIRLAVSRAQEYKADATAAFITRHPKALAMALRKISQDPRVEVLDSSPMMAAVCIDDPLKKAAFSLWATHPPIEKRIYRLENM